MKLILNPDYGLYERNGKPFCDSLQIAETFERKHIQKKRSFNCKIQKDAIKTCWLK